ncbi:MAG: AraC family transcriptional regulator, partial [Fulvivirga sp.]|nr:AraC family transcriptional regulator [Fulvivirga sp.]
MATEETHSDHSLITKLQDQVETNLNNEQFGVEKLADAVGLSRSQLHRKLKKATGQSVSQFIREYRLEKARQLLLWENLTAAEVAY